MTWNTVAYMDETHNAESYWICGLLIEVERVVEARQALIRVSEKAAVDFSLPDPPELHGHELFQGKGPFEGIPPRGRIGIYANALDAIVELEPRIVLRGVRRRNLRYQNPHRLAWRYAIESIDESSVTSPVLIVLDEHSEASALSTDINEYIAYGTGGWRPRAIKKVLPEMKVIDSRANPLVQGADLVAFLHQRRFNVPLEADDRSQRANQMLWEKIQPRVIVNRIWETPAP